MSVTPRLGSFQHQVLYVVASIGPDGYGRRIWQELEARSGESVSLGAVYATLDRLEARGFVVSRTGDPTQERGGRAKRYYELTALGSNALNRADAAMSNFRLRPLQT